MYFGESDLGRGNSRCRVFEGGWRLVRIRSRREICVVEIGWIREKWGRRWGREVISVRAGIESIGIGWLLDDFGFFLEWDEKEWEGFE